MTSSCPDSTAVAAVSPQSERYTRAMRPRRVLQSSTVEVEPFDPSAFPSIDERLRADDGAASERFRDMVASDRTIVADGAMGTMLFANGLMFGDPPEVWNLSKPDVIRRIHRGYLDAGSHILMTNTFGGNRMRLSLHGLQDRVAELNQTAAILLRSEVDAAGGNALVAISARAAPSLRPLGRSNTTRRSTSSRSRRRLSSPAASISSGSRRCPISRRSRLRSRASAASRPASR